MAVGETDQIQEWVKEVTFRIKWGQITLAQVNIWISFPLLQDVPRCFKQPGDLRVSLFKECSGCYMGNGGQKDVCNRK